MPSIKNNIILNGINTITSIIFPIVTFPYAARVLLPDGIGAVNFLNSIISYIILLTSIGIPMYAVKEVAKYRDDKTLRDKIVIEILILSFLLCIGGYIIVWVLAEFVPQIHKQDALFYVLSLSIIFTTIGVNWFYQGIEDFKFITIRALIIRVIAACSLFLFVHSPDDLIIYGFILVGSTVGNNLINFIYLRHHIDFNVIFLRELNIKRHFLPALHVFILNLIISLYIQLNSIMLGFMSGDEAVGYFTAGNKISHIGLALITSIGTVLLPRCANLIKSGDKVGFSSVINKSLNLTLLTSIPMTVGLMVLATPIITIFCGNDYGPAIPVIFITAPVVIFISLTNIMGIQILYPLDKVNLVIISVSVGAVINLILNFIMIPYYGATGAAIATLFAELFVLLSQIYLGRHYFPFTIRSLFNIKVIVASVIMGVAVWWSVIFVEQQMMKLLIGVVCGILTYAVVLTIMKEPLLSEVLLSIKSKIKKPTHV